jgi:signal transduction histidine kinase
MRPALPSLRAIQVGVIALYVFCAAVIGRTLSYIFVELPAWFPWYLGLELVFLVLFIVVMWRPRFPIWSLHLYFVLQSVIIVYLLSLPLHLDFITALFVSLSYQVALVLPGRSRWIWVGIFSILIVGSLINWLGLLRGLAFSMTPIAGNFIFLTYVIANREEELANQHSRAILSELQEKHYQLELRASQAEQIATITERNRLARELHDSVSQTMFSILLNIRATQILLEREPNRVRPQLEQLQMLTQNALSEMRSLIAQLSPQKE